MDIVHNINELKNLIKKHKSEKKSIGFVPTMGYLHKGHLSLLEAAKNENDIVVLSIFVNPTQFAPSEDLDQYPRDFDTDKSLAKKIGTDIIFFPTPEIMYPDGFSSFVVPENLDSNLCGAKRPGHFKGVMTVVLKLFNIVTPDRAYFGQKDIQQVRIVQQMIQDFNLDINMRIMPIIREKDGLALSSRNVYLNDDERSQATALSKALIEAVNLYENGERDANSIKENVIKKINEYPLANIDYVELNDYKTLNPVNGKIEKKSVLAMAVYYGKTRLIDNTILG